jgi:hypothetical protein
MSSAREIAAEVLPHFATAVLARKQHTYGHYTRLIGRNSAKESMIVGPAMHLIGSLCIISQVPVAPLYWVKRSDGEEQQIFASDPVEAEHVLPHRNMMYVVSREYSYSQSEFDAISRRLQKIVMERYPLNWTPHFIWRELVAKRPRGSEVTYFERARLGYEARFAGFRWKHQ